MSIEFWMFVCAPVRIGRAHGRLFDQDVWNDESLNIASQRVAAYLICRRMRSLNGGCNAAY